MRYDVMRSEGEGVGWQWPPPPPHTRRSLPPTMEPEEISLVQARASHIRSKLSCAFSDIAHLPASSPFHPHDLQNGHSSLESQSLTSILHALESLQLRLESLQVLQQRQRAERDACLAEIEEDRRKFLRQLKAYRGKEVEIVEEAIAFAGGNVPESEGHWTADHHSINDDAVSESPYTGTADADQIHVNVDIQRHADEGPYDLEKDTEAAAFVLQPDADEVAIGSCIEDGVEMKEFFHGNDKDSKNSMTENFMKCFANIGFAVNAVKNTVTFLGQMIFRITGQVTGPSSNVVLILLSTIIVISLTDPNEKKSKLSRSNVRQPVRCYEKVKRKKEEDYFPDCTIRVRTELPFYRELQSPDILNGRG